MGFPSHMGSSRWVFNGLHAPRFYKADADDWMKGLPWLASAAVFIFLLFWMLLILCFCKNDPQKAESDCGEDCSSHSGLERAFVCLFVCGEVSRALAGQQY